MGRAGIGAVIGFLFGGPAGAVIGAAAGKASESIDFDSPSRAPVRNTIDVEGIWDLVGRGIQYEEENHPLRDHFLDHGAEVGSEVVRFSEYYVRQMPDLIESMKRAADDIADSSLELRNEVYGILFTAQEYIFEEYDFIPDHHGLLGLIDDAYLTHRLLEEVSLEVQSHCSRPLISDESQGLNEIARKLLGPEIVGRIETKVRRTLKHPDSQHVLMDLVKVAAPMLVAYFAYQSKYQSLSGPGPVESSVRGLAAREGLSLDF